MSAAQNSSDDLRSEFDRLDCVRQIKLEFHISLFFVRIKMAI